jgi:hypothetical protein
MSLVYLVSRTFPIFLFCVQMYRQKLYSIVCVYVCVYLCFYIEFLNLFSLSTVPWRFGHRSRYKYIFSLKFSQHSIVWIVSCLLVICESFTIVAVTNNDHPFWAYIQMLFWDRYWKKVLLDLRLHTFNEYCQVVHPNGCKFTLLNTVHRVPSSTSMSLLHVIPKLQILTNLWDKLTLHCFTFPFHD